MLGISGGNSHSSVDGTGVVEGIGGGAAVWPQPSASGTQLTFLPDGVRVRVVCTAQGDSVQDPSGRPVTLWDRIENPDGFVADAFLQTGTFNPVAPACSK